MADDDPMPRLEEVVAGNPDTFGYETEKDAEEAMEDLFGFEF